MSKSENLPSDCFIAQKFLLNCFGLLYNENVLRKVLTISLLISLTIYLFSIFPEILKIYHDDFQKFIQFAVFEIGLLTCLICMYCTFWNRFAFKELFEKLQLLDTLSNFKNSEREIVLIKQYKDVVRKQAYFGILWIINLQIVFISGSVVISLNEEKWILPFGSGSSIIHNDDIQFIIQIIVFDILTVNLMLLIIIYINILTLICGHCKLLQKYVALSFTDYEEEISEDLDVILIEKKTPDWKTFKVHLQHIVSYHIGIIDVTNQIEAVFSIITFVIFGGTSTSMCLAIYHTQLNIGIMETTKDAFIIITGYMIMILISIYGEQVATESSKIASVCYELDFVGCDLRIQKSLILIMAISQRTITPTIGKIRVLSLRTMLSIMQSIYSYYNILRNLMNE